MRSIKQKLLVRILAMTAAAALICGGVGIAANYISSHSMLEQSLESTASLAATRVSYELLSYQNAVRGLGMVPELSDGAVPVTEKERIVDHWAPVSYTHLDVYKRQEGGNAAGFHSMYLFRVLLLFFGQSC